LPEHLIFVSIDERFAASLSEDSRRRLEVNPLRILESKERRDQELVRDAPLSREYLCDECRAHFEQVKRLFSVIGVPYVEDPHVVRGLDYYTRTAAEIYSGRLGGAEMSRQEKAIRGSIPLSTLQRHIDYGFAASQTKAGLVGVKVWIDLGDYSDEETADGTHAKAGQAPQKSKRAHKR